MFFLDYFYFVNVLLLFGFSCCTVEQRTALSRFELGVTKALGRGARNFWMALRTCADQVKQSPWIHHGFTMDSPWVHHGFTMLNAGLAHLPKLWTPRSTHHKYVITTLYTPKKCTPRSVNRKQFIKQFTTPSHKLPIRRRNQKNNSPQTPSTKNSNG